MENDQGVKKLDKNQPEGRRKVGRPRKRRRYTEEVKEELRKLEIRQWRPPHPKKKIAQNRNAKNKLKPAFSSKIAKTEIGLQS